MTLSLTDSERDIVTNILQTIVPSATVWVFGSRATGSSRKTSDLDLLIDAGEQLSFLTTGNLREAFSLSRLPYFVDIVDATSTNQEFLDEIKDECMLIWDGAAHATKTQD